MNHHLHLAKGETIVTRKVRVADYIHYWLYGLTNGDIATCSRYAAMGIKLIELGYQPDSAIQMVKAKYKSDTSPMPDMVPIASQPEAIT